MDGMTASKLPTLSARVPTDIRVELMLDLETNQEEKRKLDEIKGTQFINDKWLGAEVRKNLDMGHSCDDTRISVISATNECWHNSKIGP